MFQEISQRPKGGPNEAKLFELIDNIKNNSSITAIFQSAINKKTKNGELAFKVSLTYKL